LLLVYFYLPAVLRWAVLKQALEAYRLTVAQLAAADDNEIQHREC